jgi:hypothetical protein
VICGPFGLLVERCGHCAAQNGLPPVCLWQTVPDPAAGAASRSPFEPPSSLRPYYSLTAHCQWKNGEFFMRPDSGKIIQGKIIKTANRRRAGEEI